MPTLDTWWSPAAQCYRIEDGEMFTYFHLDEVIGHFRHRDQPAGARLAAPLHDVRTAMLDLALRRAGIPVDYNEAAP
jgi:hypothetical protein